MKRIRESESGQVLVILVGGIVALLAFAALAIDGGMFYSDRRFDQNAADASALAGAGAAASALDAVGVVQGAFSCTDSDVAAAITAAETAAIQRAAANGFTIDTDISDQHGVQVVCQITDSGTVIYLDTRVLITTTTQTSFAHLIFDGDMENSVEAITRVELGVLGPFADGYAILALREECEGGDGGIEFDGDSLVTVVTGGAFSNACVVKNGTADVYTDSGVFYYTTFANNGASGSILPEDPEQADTRLSVVAETPACQMLPSYGEIKKGGSIQPGNYTKISLSNKDTLTMAPGLYCLTGTLKMTGGLIEIDGAPEDGVTIYLSGGDFEVTGGAVYLRAPLAGYEVNYAIPGMLIYMAEDNDGVITITGNANSTYRGTVYALTGLIEVGGTASSMGPLSSQFVADKVKVHGNSALQIEFEEGEIYWSKEPSYLDLYK